MELRNLLVVIVIVTCTHVQTFADERNEVEELRTMLRESRDQNRRMGQQMHRLKLVWTGLQKMCEVLSTASTLENDAGESSEEERPMTILSATSSGNETGGWRWRASEKEHPMSVLSASSSGNETGEITVSVVYTAPPDHATEWFIRYYEQEYDHSDRVRTAGITSGQGPNYTSTVVIPHTQLLSQLVLHLFAGNETIGLIFNDDMVGNISTQTVPEYQSPILHMNTNYLTPTTGELNITIVFNKTQADLNKLIESGADVSLTGFSETGNTPKVFIRSNIHRDTFDFSTHPTLMNLTSYAVITVKPPYAQFGGFFAARFPRVDLEYGLLNEIIHGYTITVTSPDQELVPRDTVALYEIDATTVMATHRLTIMCAAFGNPIPMVKMYRESDDGTRIELPSEQNTIDRWSQSAYYTLNASDKSTHGTYVCRAESGNGVAERSTEVIVYEPVIFDEAKTAVLKNNTKKIVFGCKASGTERPALEFRLYYASGPKLDNSEKFKVSERRIGKSSKRITLTVSPPDYTIHTVVCVSRLHGIEQHRELELISDQLSWNYELYNSLTTAMTPHS